MGVEVHQSSRSDEARQALLEGNFDLAVLCLPPEGGDVLRLASRLRAEAATRDLPVLLTADPSQRGLVLRGFDLGANDHVLRPIDANELRARARNQVRRKWYQERLRNDLDRSLELAVTDPLTGLRNRRYVRRHLDGVLRGSDAAVMLLDVDRFKPINDTYGHAAGDAALKEVAERLKSHLRAADVLARYGGEEFMVVLAGAPTDYAAMVADRLRGALSNDPISVGPALLPITVSIGLAIAPGGLFRLRRHRRGGCGALSRQGGRAEPGGAGGAGGLHRRAAGRRRTPERCPAVRRKRKKGRGEGILPAPHFYFSELAPAMRRDRSTGRKSGRVAPSASSLRQALRRCCAAGLT